MSDTSSINESTAIDAKTGLPATGVQSTSNADRLEKKKNREKRRRSEVNDRFDELIEVMEDAQSQMINAPPFSNEFSKGVLTKAGLLEKAVELVKLLAEENKKLKTMIQPSALQPAPALPPFDPTLAQKWMANNHVMPGFNASAMQQQQPSLGLGSMVDCPPFMGQPQPMMFPHAPNGMPPMGYHHTKPSVLSYHDMLQLGDWNQGSQVQFQHGSGMKPLHQKTIGYEAAPQAPTVGPAPLSTHAECA